MITSNLSAMISLVRDRRRRSYISSWMTINSYAATNNLTQEKGFTVPIVKYVRGLIEKGGGAAGSGGGNNRLSTKPSQLKHMFGDRPGHLPDTPENRALFESIANNNETYLGTDSMNARWYAQIQPDGSQVWVRVWNGTIFNGGINEIPRPWDSTTGLNNNPFK